MFKKINSYRIKKRLSASFRWVITISAIVSVGVALVMLYMVEDYKRVLNNYAYPQGDIAMAMNYTSEVRSALRGVIGYNKEDMIEKMKTSHDTAIQQFNDKLEEIRPTMITKAGLACMANIDSAWEAYLEVDQRVLALGATTDVESSIQAQNMMFDEVAPKYQALESAMEELMTLNEQLGNKEQTKLVVLFVISIIIIAAVIAFVVVFSTRLAKSISRSIEIPLNELSERFISFSEGDLDSPLPEIQTQDEIKDLVDSVAVMGTRLNTIINDAGRLLQEMSNGNFAITTECEDQYMGAFNALILGIRNMNRQINATIRGVDDASKQVAEGSNNLAQSAQALAEGATEQAATTEEIQATINELNESIQHTAKELEKSYKEAQAYAETADGSRVDMEALMGAMERISETSEKIGNIIAEIEDIASQTNLLSLNASIEAARAGDAGRGFAVVADQIRNLAEQSAKSATDSRELIEASLHEVREGSKIATKASDSLKEVVVGVQTIAESAKKISELSVTQASGMEQADLAVARISEVIQSNSAAAQESSATSEELSSEAATLSDMVSRFKLRDR